jgi:hypothetical protein
MNSPRGPDKGKLMLPTFGASFAPLLGAEAGRLSRGATLSFRANSACHKLLKIGRLAVFQKGAILPIFRQASLGRKRETLWAVGTLPLDHRSNTRIAYLASNKVSVRSSLRSIGELLDAIA